MNTTQENTFFFFFFRKMTKNWDNMLWLVQIPLLYEFIINVFNITNYNISSQKLWKKKIVNSTRMIAFNMLTHF